MLNSKRKFFVAILFLFLSVLFVNFSEAADNKSRNIFELFTNSNPSLKAKTAKSYIEIITSACKKYNQDPYVIAGIIVHESTVNNKAVGGNNYGLMQINWPAHKKLITNYFPKVKKAKDLFDAKTNIFYGTKVFADCMSRSDSIKGGLLLYSGGSEKLASKVLKTLKELQAKDTDKKTRKGK